MSRICEELECSERTARRWIAELRDYLNAPVRYDRNRRGWHYTSPERDHYQLPGMWFSPDEAHALLASFQLLEGLQPGLLAPYIAPIRDRLQALLSHRHVGHRELTRRIRLLQVAVRSTDLKTFRKLATAVLERRRLRIFYHGRARDATTERVVSPQRLVYYRSNWYLDAWCHWRRALRSFAVDRIHPVEIQARPARDLPDKILDDYYASAYGIFAGRPRHTARLRFSSRAARWVADEQWHPAQREQVLEDGGYELRIPYSRPDELIMDILKYGPEVEVLGPKALRARVAAAHRAAARRYGAGV